ncbi:MAG TPA: DUF2723 domain-containing protein [Alistipes sp.]|uniref:glycosyltransferase family 117 protein n=1 Tax=unclassified Alistipes TaxID=2608932 RepID=UPI00258AFB67|nr:MULTISPECIES: DUF2723 domain-containing protein [unclassified Alistipes]HUN14820.1 DUF2723 domain-containing protein [Alistipes sp.]
MNLFKRWNNLVGWAVFAVAAVVYLLTMEPVSSLWDCSEFIATSYKLEVGHPPGAPLFMMLARLATLFAFGNPEYVGMAVNAMNSIASAFCILFLFWTITHLARRLVTRDGRELSAANVWAVLGAGAVGALAYTFTDTFWFSAIEGEVYALSSMFTALVVWLMLKWEEEADQPHASRWIVLIAYLMGLSIGVHILNLLTIPALVFIYYFRTTPSVTWRGLVGATLIAGAILLVINGIIIPYTVYVGAMFDLFFVNTFGLPVNSGMVFFALALIGGLGWASWATHKRGKVLWNVVLLSTTMILVGFSSYASVSIRAAANPPMNSNKPDNPHALLSVLNRDQYGDRPLLYGAYYSAPPADYKEKHVYYLDEDGKYKPASIITGYTHAPEFMHLFPRMWNRSKGEKDYKQWAAYRTKTDYVRDDSGELVRDAQGRPLRQEVVDFGRKRTFDDGYGLQTIVEPTFGENLSYFFNYQLSYMYWRYFLWNFVGRQSDIQPSASTITDGNWLSGIRFIDEAFLGPQDNLPREIAGNRGRNTYYFLPFILGLIGLVYQLNRDQRNFSIVMWLFIMTGIALVVYFNSAPSEPRERDYVYAGSFYAFCIWIGFGVLAVRDFVAWLTKRNNVAAAAVATAVCMGVPTILAAQNWDDHDRSGRYMARDIGWNYLMSTLPNSIILNYGDNDTFPLWNNQEVYGVRPDVRIMNTSYLGGEWYIDEMKTRANDAAGVPFSLPKSKYTYNNDWIPVNNRIDRAVEIGQVIDFIRSDDPRTKIALEDGTQTDYIPTKRIALPVNKENALAAGIVAEKDRDLMVDTVYINLRKSALDKSQLMILDMLANFDWKRPIYMTQIYIFQDLGLLDYLQFDGYAYRFVPILTPVDNPWEIGRVDVDYAVPLLRDTFRYGNLADPDVYVDYFLQYNLSASHARDAFARVAKELLRQERPEEAVELLDLGLERLPTSQIRFTDTNTYPFLEAYYAAGAMGVEGAVEKGDALLEEYAQTLIEYIEYYLRFEGVQGDMVSSIVDDKLEELGDLYYLASYAGRRDIIAQLNAYYRTLGVSEDSLVDVGDKPRQADSVQIGS